MGAFEGQSVMVTGGGSGIGLACATRFAAQGAVVGLIGRSDERLEQGAAQIRALHAGANVLCFAGNVAEESVVEHALAATHAAAPLTAVLANAGTGALAPVTLTDTEQFDTVMQVNLRGTFLSFKHGGRLLSESGGGAMCAISSIAGLRTHRYMGAYCVSKAGIDMLVRNTADELGHAGIRVNSVCPGLVDTELASGLLQTPSVYEDYLDCMPIRRHGSVEDIADAVYFLCGPDSRWVTGVNLAVDGGHHLRRGPNVEPFVEQLFPDYLT